MSFKLGDKEYKRGLLLAPMAGFSDRAMRLMAKEYGADITYTEMVSAVAATRGDKKTKSLAEIQADEGDVILQIFGSEPAVMAEAAGRLLEGLAFSRPVSIDINCGCPVRKIFSSGEGSALMAHPERIYDIVRKTREAINIPVSVKMRLGIDEGHISVFECAVAAEEAGASMIAVHGRTKEQMYSGQANREIIKKVKSCVHIPVIANGDIKDKDSAIGMLSETCCDGIMIGRGAIGNPFVFREIRAALDGEEYRAPTLADKIAAAKRQLDLAIADKGEGVAVREARGQLAHYFAGFRGSAMLRAAINSAKSAEEILRAISALTE